MSPVIVGFASWCRIWPRRFECLIGKHSELIECPSIVESLQTVKAEGFGFNYTRWQQVSSYRSSMSFRSLTLEPVAPVEMASPSIISA